MNRRVLQRIALFGMMLCLLLGTAAAEEWYDSDPTIGAAQTTSETEQTAAQQRFSDVSATDWYYSVVMQLAENGTIDGYPDGTFRPQRTVTTGQALKMILLAAGYEEPERVHRTGRADIWIWRLKRDL